MDARAQFVVVGEMVDNAGESANGIERFAAYREGRTEAVAEATFEPAGKQYTGLKVSGDAERLHPRRNSAMGTAPVKRCDQAYAAVFRAFGRSRGKLRHHALQAARRDGDVGVVDEQKIVTSMRSKLRQSADLAVRAEAQRTFDQPNRARGEFAPKLPDRCDRRIVQ